MHTHSYHCFPCADPDLELPLYCVECFDNNDFDNPAGIQWLNGKTMSFNHWNSFYDKDGNLKDPNHNPAKNNRRKNGKNF